MKVGDEVRLSDRYGGIVQKRFRGRIIRVIEDDLDLDGVPLVRIERLDLPSHKRENWSQSWLVKLTQQ